MIIHEIHGKVTPSSGTASVNLVLHQLELRQVIIQTTTDTTTFDIKIVNAQDFEVYDNQNLTGFVSERLNIPTRGNMTLEIENASVDEEFKYFISAIERYA